MSEDEMGVLVFSLAAAVMGWGAWLVAIGRRYSRREPRPYAVAAALFAPMLVLALLVPILLAWSSPDVRTSALYTVFYGVMGLAWTGLARGPASFALAVHPRHDVGERANTAAATALLGMLAGLTLCFAGGNIGAGPGWWVVVFCAALSTGAFVVAWLLVQLSVPVREAIVVDRDLASGVRSAGASVALGLVLGRSVAGDWVSVEATVRDFVVGALPALVTVVAEVVFSLLLAPTPRDPKPALGRAGLLPALIHVTYAVGVVVLRHPW